MSVDIEDQDPRFAWVDYVNLLKPRVMSLVVFTAWVGMFMAPGDIDPFKALMAITCVAVGAGASGAINMWYDRDIDIDMERTKNRPIPAGNMDPLNALVFGIILSIASVVMMYVYVGEKPSGLLAFTILYYVFLYTMWLKRRTPQNIVIGGAAGAFPPMIGWVSVTGDFAFESGILFAIIFLWTPPHTWALALFRNADYTKVGVPMMPVVVGAKKTKIQIVLYTIALVAASLAPGFVGEEQPMSGVAYMVGASVLGLLFLIKTIKLLGSDEDKDARATFLFSLLYLFLIFAFLVVDQFIYMPLSNFIPALV